MSSSPRILSFGLVAALSACSPASDGADALRTSPGDRAGMALRMAASNPDVAGFHMTIDAVACAPGDTVEPWSDSIDVELSDNVFGAEGPSSQPFDESSEHRGADVFVSVPVGCYEVVAAPVARFDEDGFTPSSVCSADRAQALVMPAQTTEVTLISQCEGDPTGAIDALALTNHPPVIELEIADKYPLTCEPTRICATVWDEDDDPIAVDIEQLAGPEPFASRRSGATLVGFEGGHRLWEVCGTVAFDEIADVEARWTAYDMGYDEQGDPIRIERLIEGDSHASLSHPLYTTELEDLCVQDGDLRPVDGVWARRLAGCDWRTPQDFYCDDPEDPALVPFVCDADGQLRVGQVYPECEDLVIDTGTPGTPGTDTGTVDTGTPGTDTGTVDTGTSSPDDSATADTAVYDTGIDDDDDDDDTDDDDDDATGDTGTYGMTGDTGMAPTADTGMAVACRTQGYWKNHPSEWGTTELILGGTTYDQADLLAMLDEPVQGNMALNLVHQLIPAKLNVIAGTDPSIGDTLDAADAWIIDQGGLPTYVSASSPAGQEGESIKDTLDAYNNGC